LGFSVGINFNRMAMWPSFHLRVWSRLLGHFVKRHYAVATAHGVSGALAEFLGMYILLIAGTNLLPQR
jgi:hypothetical protein